MKNALRIWAAGAMAVAMAVAVSPHARADLSASEAAMAVGCGRYAEVSVSATVFPKTYVGFPLLVRVSAGSPSGFQYSQALPKGADVRFCDIETGEVLPHEIDTWNASGTSFIWVKVPELTSATKLLMCWGKLSGADLAQVDSTEVWTDYVGVWHFKEAVSSSDAATGSVAASDSTANGLDAKPYARTSGDLSRQVSTNGVVGLGRMNADTVNSAGDNTRGSANMFKVNSYESLDVNDTFTFSGWFLGSNYNGLHPCFVSRKPGQATGEGWELKYSTTSDRKKLEMYGSGSTKGVVTMSKLPYNTGTGVNRGFFHVALVYKGGKVTFYENGAPFTARTITAAANNSLPLYIGGCGYDDADGGGRTTSFWGAFDEHRLMRGEASADWIKADYGQMNNAAAVVLGAAAVADGAEFENSWVAEPTLSKTSWYVGDPAAVVNAGTAVNGSAEVSYVKVADSSVHTEMPTEKGVYKAVFTVPAADHYEGLSYELDFEILGRSPYTDLSGEAEDISSSGRVLLMNRDLRDAAAVENQGYYDRDSNGTLSTQTNRTTFWHVDVDDAVSDTLYNLQNGTAFTLWTRGYGRRLWRLLDCRHGNTFPQSNTGVLASEQNYLAWSSTSRQNTAHNSRPVTRATVGQCVMRNIADEEDPNKCAAVCSPYYEDGIGTIYFDAVNGWNDNLSSDPYRIVVEVSTNVVDSVEPPRDDLIVEYTENYDITQDPGSDEIITNLISITTNEFAKAEWHPVPVTLYKMDYAASYSGARTFTTNYVPAGDFALDIVNGGTTGNFIRVCVPLDYKCPARFRIRRVSKDGDRKADTEAMILLDNIIASFPTMRADLHPYGRMDVERSGKQTLGQAAAFSVPFPSASETNLFARAYATYMTNSSKPGFDIDGLVSVAKMCYRWRYLDQRVDGWTSVRLDPSDHFRSVEPLKLPGEPGDLEFFYETALDSPYYEYVDYSGRNLGVPGYTENPPFVTNAARSAVMYQSRGTDWFARLRPGESDYEGFDMLTMYIGPDGQPMPATNTVHMELVGDHVWRGYFKTVASTNEDDYVATAMKYRFEGLNRQTPGHFAWAQNVLRLKPTDDMAKDWPMSGIMEECDEDGWATMSYNYSTGCIMFQIDETTRSVTAVHADYQNFNAWNDAKGEKFVGNNTEDGKKSGASAKAVSIDETFNTWLTMPATNVFWTESFSSTNALDKADYTYFPSTRSPNGWSVGPGMWVYGKYRDERHGRAFQMKGQGEGFLQYVDGSLSPRGLESVSFTARLAQFVEFSDFCFWDCGNKAQLTNYTATARVAFDNSSSTAFSGNASLSLVAYYTPSEGCYEFRVEQGLANGTAANSGIDKRGQILTLNRWRYDSRGRMVCTTLGAVTNSTAFSNDSNSDFPLSNSKNSGYMPIYLSVSNATDATGGACIMAGYRRATSTGVGASDAVDTVMGKTFNNICYRDTSPDRLTGGTMGLLSAGCNGVFLKPYALKKPVPFMTNLTTPNKFDKYSDKSITKFDKTNDIMCGENDITAKNWKITAGRMESFHDDSNVWGIRGKAPEQSLGIYIAASGSATFPPEPDVTNVVANFGSSSAAGQTCRLNLYSTKDCSVKIASVGDIYDIRTDIVLDDVELCQWRGDNWNNSDNMPQLVPGWQPDSNYRALTNFTFTSGWITNKAVLLSAKRTTPGTPCSIRSPLFDGKYGRGTGLGMISFGYRDAQTNMNLLVQIATNVDYNDIATASSSLSNAWWTTVTNFSFRGVSAEERSAGVRSCYVGRHGVSGAMRILVDPALVDAVSNVTDRTAFGEITITEVFCRDEPTLDTSSWWGWNLRTLGPDTAGSDSEGRMFLPDLASGAADTGLSLALNNSTTADVNEFDPETYKQHLPFIQTPTFGTNLVGEISFKARRYDAGIVQPAVLRLYGSTSGQLADKWVPLADFIVTNDFYGPYSYKTQPSETYMAFRLAVPGVEEVTGTELARYLPDNYGYDAPTRVLLDEVLVSEAVRARMAFRHVGAFRSEIGDTSAVPGVPGEKEQPLCGEAWGVQCEVYPAQLPDEIDLEREPRVRLSWYPYDTPWGYENWKTNSAAKSAWLAPATGTNLVYRSSYVTAPGAVIDSTFALSGTVVQYMLEVVYYMAGGSVPVTNLLTSSDWTTPSWYSPVDYNATKGGGFAAYNILDTVAPHWGWINEVNIYGGLDEYSGLSTEVNDQFIEVAVPAEADLTGWEIRLLDPQIDGEGKASTIITNVLGKFGAKDLTPTKTDNLGLAENMVFRVLATPFAVTGPSTIMKKSDGTMDAAWRVENGSGAAIGDSGEIQYLFPFGLQFVRASGVVEHEIICMGTNFFNVGEGESFYEMYNPTNYVRALNEAMNTTNFFFIGYDDGGEENSVGVVGGNGSSSNQWSKAMRRTPGRINEGQTIDPDHPTPQGTSILVTFMLDNDFGHIAHTVGDEVDGTNSQIVVLQKGSDRGTNVIYRVAPWFELGEVTTNGVAVQPLSADAANRLYTVNVGKGASNNFTVVGAARVKESLRLLGVDDANPYKMAIVDWLTKRRTLKGESWANPDSDEFKPAKFWELGADKSAARDMTVNEMYWLDMDPTVGDLYLRGGFDPSGPPMPHITAGGENVRMTIALYMTNATEDAANPWYAQPAWSPYALRGLAPGESSLDYSEDVEWNWTSATFKVSAIINNGYTSETNQNNWIPLRFFVFHEDSFDPAGHTTKIEIVDPLSDESPAAREKWKEWIDENAPGTRPIYYRWFLDRRRVPFDAEVLKTENYYE